MAAAAAATRTHDTAAPPELGPPPALGRSELVARTRVHVSPLNPRKHHDPAKLDELTESVRRHNILQPLLVRERLDGDFELAAGERRLIAAERVGLPEVPIVVREMTDEQLVDAALHENGKREDVHPLDEADAYAQKRDKFGRSVEEIAATAGRPRGYIYQRLSLCALGDKPRKAFFDAKLTTATALLLARIPVKELQDKALAAITRTDQWSEPMTAHEAAEHIQREYMLRLAGARFDTADASLVPKAGPCTACLKNTGNQRELFADVGKDSLCTDPKCFAEKTTTAAKQKLEAAAAGGAKVLSATKAKEIWPEYSGASKTKEAGYVDLDERCREDVKKRTYRDLLKKSAKVAAVAQHPRENRVVELLDAATVKAAIKAAGHDLKKDRAASRSSRSGGADPWQKRQQTAKKDKELKKKVIAAALAQLLPAVEKATADAKYFRLLVNAELLEQYYQHEDVLKRRGLKPSGGDKKKIEQHIATLSEAQLRALLIEMAIGSGIENYKATFEPALVAACTLYKVDLKKLEADERAAQKVKEKAAAPKGKKKDKAAPAKKGAKPRSKRTAAAPPIDDGGGDDEDPDVAGGGHKLPPGVCWACGCTEQRACMTPAGPCSWFDESKNLCTNPKCLDRAGLVEVEFTTDPAQAPADCAPDARRT